MDLDTAALSTAVVARQHDYVIPELEIVIGLDAPLLPSAQPRAQTRIGIAIILVDAAEAGELVGPSPLHVWVVDGKARADVAAAPLLEDRPQQVGVAALHQATRMPEPSSNAEASRRDIASAPTSESARTRRPRRSSPPRHRPRAGARSRPRCTRPSRRSGARARRSPGRCRGRLRLRRSCDLSQAGNARSPTAATAVPGPR